MTYDLYGSQWLPKRPLARADGISKLILVVSIVVDSHQFSAKILYCPKDNNHVYCSNYDRRYYRLCYKIPSSSLEDFKEHSCDPKDPRAVVLSSPPAKKK